MTVDLITYNYSRTAAIMLICEASQIGYSIYCWRHWSDNSLWRLCVALNIPINPPGE